MATGNKKRSFMAKKTTYYFFYIVYNAPTDSCKSDGKMV